MKLKTQHVLAIVVSSVLIGGLAQPAAAAPRGPIEALERVQERTSSVATAVLEDNTAFRAERNAPGLSAAVPGVRFEAPASSKSPVRLSAEADTGAHPLEIGLPFADVASEVVAHDEGVVSYQNDNDSTTVVAAKTDGSVQIATVLDSPSAPERYTYEILGDGEGELIIDGDGRVHVVGASGYVTAVIEPAWAYDARGVEVPTH